jgi:hypothetical protein
MDRRTRKSIPVIRLWGFVFFYVFFQTQVPQKEVLKRVPSFLACLLRSSKMVSL